MQPRRIIPGVRKVSWDTGEMCEFASCLVSALLCLGEDISYDTILGASGVAFRFTLNPGEWDFGNYSIRNISPDPGEPVRRAFDAAGFECSLCEKSTFREDAARIMDSIDRGVPALVFGVVGPSDCCIISGYDEGGEVLLGWSTFQDIPADHDVPPDETGYFRKPGWHDNLGGTVLIGARKEPRPKRAVTLDAIRWAVTLARLSGMGKKLAGLEGLRAWAVEMSEEKYFPADDADLLGWRYVGTTINFTMLRDHVSAEAFLRQAAVEAPEFLPELAQAAECYHQVKGILKQMDAIISDNFAEWALKAFADPEMRRAYAVKILEVQAVEEQATQCLERLLERCA